MPLTIGLLSYKQEQYIEAAVRAILNQDYDDLEIIISDDASPDRTFEIIQDTVARSDRKNQVKLNCNKQNLGLATHVSKVMEMASNEIVMMAAGDDVSMPNRAAKTAELMADESVKVLSFGLNRFSDDQEIRFNDQKEVGECKRYRAEDLFTTPTLHTPGASRAYRKELIDVFGPLQTECPTEDSSLLVRAFLLGDVMLCQDVEVNYRVHGANIHAGQTNPNIDLEAIQSQYLADVEQAGKLGLVDEKTVELFRKTVRARTAMKYLDHGFKNSKSPLYYFFSRVLFNMRIGLRQKYRFLKRVMEGGKRSQGAAK